MTLPTASDAALSISEAERASARVRASSSRYVAWLVGMSATTAMYFVGLAISGEDVTGIVAMSVALAVVAVALSAGLLPGAVVARRGFSVRWGIAVGAWGLLFGATLGIGLALAPGALWFWIPAGILTAAPLAWGAIVELRA